MLSNDSEGSREHRYSQNGKVKSDNQDILLFWFCLFCFLTEIKYNVYGLVFVGVWTGTCVGFDDGGASMEK